MTHVHVHDMTGSLDFRSVPAAVVGQVARVSDWKGVGHVVGATTQVPGESQSFVSDFQSHEVFAQRRVGSQDENQTVA